MLNGDLRALTINAPITKTIEELITCQIDENNSIIAQTKGQKNKEKKTKNKKLPCK
tara:strand:- start:156 stop:323 length:168 start_codon:yes stop_codon:yes gene_type:complete